ncbi:type II toxin-antitoxin system RelE/ParE family toxin [Desulfovibrio cuneatus]|uniref:type II toxin-antitoxin system RelE/ParE family toxin n=1 Tax=Desulfovibrio cuneatus TaxID=159728 RepID=UPI0004063295
MKLVWTPQAIEDCKHIFAFIYEHDEEAAEAMDKLFVAQADFLLDYPQKGGTPPLTQATQR